MQHNLLFLEYILTYDIDSKIKELSAVELDELCKLNINKDLIYKMIVYGACVYDFEKIKNKEIYKKNIINFIIRNIKLPTINIDIFKIVNENCLNEDYLNSCIKLYIKLNPLELIKNSNEILFNKIMELTDEEDKINIIKKYKEN